MLVTDRAVLMERDAIKVVVVEVVYGMRKHLILARLPRMGPFVS